MRSTRRSRFLHPEWSTSGDRDRKVAEADPPAHHREIHRQRHPADDRTFPGAVGGALDLHWRSSAVSLRIVSRQLDRRLRAAIWPVSCKCDRAFAKREETRFAEENVTAGRRWQLLRTMLRMRRFEEAVLRSRRAKVRRALSHLYRPGGGRRRDHRRARAARPARHDASQPRPHHRPRRRSREGAGGNSGARRRAQRRPQRNAASLRPVARLYLNVGGSRRLHLARGRCRLCLQAGRRGRSSGRVLWRRRARRGRQLRGHEHRVADAAAGAVRLREQQRGRLGCGARRVSELGSRRRRRSPADPASARHRGRPRQRHRL